MVEKSEKKLSDIKISSSDIKKLLANKHSTDVFISECKMGSSYAGDSPIIDAWAMKKSWTSLAFTGYEIKISRSDFLADNKYHQYLPACTYFYLVTTKGVIKDKNEIPENVGWIEVSTNGGRLWTKKKAPLLREIQLSPLESVLVYLLMWRTEVTKEKTLENHRNFDKGKGNYWKKWAETKEYDKIYGHMISNSIAKTIFDKNMELKSENAKLKETNENLLDIKNMLDDMGIDTKYWWNAKENVAKKLKGDIDVYSRNTMRIIEKLDKFKEDCSTFLNILNKDEKNGG